MKFGLQSILISTLRIFASILQTKVVAVAVGINGYAYYALMQNLIALGQSVISGPLSIGTITLTSKYEKNFLRISLLITVITYAFIFLSLIFSATIIPLCLYFDKCLPSNYGLDNRLMLFLLLFSTIGQSIFGVAVSIMNGLSLAQNFLKANIIFALLISSFVSLGAIINGLIGSIIGLTFGSIIVGVVSILSVSKILVSKGIKIVGIAQLFGLKSKYILTSLGKFASVTTLSTVFLLFTQYITRDFLISKYGVSMASNWDATIRISMTCNIFILTFLQSYVLPKLSVSKEIDTRYLTKIMFFCGTFSFSIFGIFFLASDFIVITLLSAEFDSVAKLIIIVSFADAIKNTFLVLAFMLLAKSKHAKYLIIEFCFSSSFLFLLYLYLDNFYYVSIFYLYSTLIYTALLILTSLYRRTYE